MPPIEMDTGPRGLSQVLSRMSNAARERAPVAAEFEDCSQRFDRLSSVMEANELTWEPYQILLNDYRSRLATWGSDTGARSRTIDYTLRKSSRLQSQALDLLEHLHESLQNILDLVETTATPMLAPPTANLPPPQSYFDARSLAEDASQSAAVLEKKIRPYIEAIAELFDHLASLVPSLQDPVPWDDYQKGEPGENLQMEVERAKRMFGKAPPALVERFGRANWKRSRYLQHLRERALSLSPKTAHSTSKSGPKREFQLPTRVPLQAPNDNEDITREPDKVDVRRQPTLGFTTSTTLSTGSTTFSKRKASAQMSSRPATSVAETEENQKPEPTSEPGRYFVPKPPTALEPHKAFICPYCLHEITVGAEEAPEKDWADHVYMDLEPYMCTYELCPREQKTYGSKEDWFRHELNTHRILKIYFCQTCELEYEEQALLEQHLWEAHDRSLQPRELAVIASMCARFSQKPSTNQGCHLCGETCLTMQLLRDHLADHLEQFALTSVKSEDEFEDDPPLSPQFSDSGSEQRFRLGLAGLEDLELMVEEKVEPILQQTSTSKQTSGDATVGIPKIQIERGSAMKSAMRPTLGKRGDSYTLTSRAKEHIDQFSAMTAVSKKSSQVDSTHVIVDQASNAAQSSCTVRTGVAPRKAEFEGRIQDLKELYTKLSVPGHTCFLSGTGGIGKSALAAEYTYRFETEYSYIFWVQAETPIVCADTYCQIATKIVLKDEAASEDQEKLIMLSREFLQKTTKRWLLIFDNVDEWLDLKHFLPKDFPETSGSILITTQRVDLIQMSKWSKVSQITLDGLSLDESRRLLLKYSQQGLDPTDMRSHAEFKLAGDIAKLAERLPLALSLIAGYILVSGCSLADFVELWNERRRNMQRMGAMPSSSTDAALETAWDLGLREVPVDARDLLSILAFLDSDNIQREMLIDDHEEPILEMLRPVEAGRFKRMKVQLRRRNLITVEIRSGEEIWSIHRSLQAKILQELNRDPQKRERVYAQAFLLIRNRFPLPSPIQVPEPSKWPACRRYLPHVLSLRKIFTGHMLEIPPSIKLAQLFSDGGIDLWERGMTNEGLDLLKSAEAILDQLDCREDLLRANIHVIISLLIQDSGLTQLAECKSRISSVLDIRKKHHDTTPPELYTKNDEILLYNAWSDYGCVLLQYDTFREAEPIFAACFEKYKSWGPPEAIPYEYSKYYHHMAFCLMYRRRFAEAIELAEQGLHWVAVATGHSAAYNRWKFDLACIVLQSGDLNRALTLHQEILESRIEQHGSSAYLTLQSWYSVGAVQAYIGDLASAENSMQRFLSLATSRDDPCPEAAIARTRFHLSNILRRQEKCLTEAQELEEISMQTLHMLSETQCLETLKDVKDGHELALFDHLQPVFDGRFTGRHILEYLSA